MGDDNCGAIVDELFQYLLDGLLALQVDLAEPNKGVRNH
jgi:hypothetical protein